MKKMIYLAIPLLFVLIAFHPSDDFVVTGTIYDDKGQPIPYATVVEKNTKNATRTDSVGHFYLTVKTQKAVLVVTAVGYSTKEIRVEGKQVVSVKLPNKPLLCEETALKNIRHEEGYRTGFIKLVTQAQTLAKKKKNYDSHEVVVKPTGKK
jgi:iron complex outermembrane receptor protein